MPYTFLDLPDMPLDVPPDSILSRTVFTSPELKAVLFEFAPGTELSEHTAARPAILHFLAGGAELTLGEETMGAGPGAWVHLPANLAHSIRAQTAVRMLLYLLG